jgi:hypothetical protein
MPVPAAAAAAYSAAVNAAPFALPLIPAAIVGAFIAFQDPQNTDVVKLTGSPEAAAECMKRNAASIDKRLVAEVSPLYGTEVMGVVLKRGVVGSAFMSIVIQEANPGSQAEIRPLAPVERQPEMVAKIVAGC